MQKKRNVDKKMFKIWIRDVIDNFLSARHGSWYIYLVMEKKLMVETVK